MKTGLVGSIDGPLDAHTPKGTHADSPIDVTTPGTTPMFQLDQLLRGFSYKGLDHILVSQKSRFRGRCQTMEFRLSSSRKTAAAPPSAETV